MSCACAAIQRRVPLSAVPTCCVALSPDCSKVSAHGYVITNAWRACGAPQQQRHGALAGGQRERCAAVRQREAPAPASAAEGAGVDLLGRFLRSTRVVRDLPPGCLQRQPFPQTGCMAMHPCTECLAPCLQCTPGAGGTYEFSTGKSGNSFGASSSTGSPAHVHTRPTYLLGSLG